VTIHMETLNAARTRVSVADIAFTSTGEILAATSDGGVSSAIQCHRIKLCREIDGSCKIECNSATGFYARCHLDAATRDSATARVTHVKYMQRDAGGDMLIIGAGDVNGSSVELWNLTNQPISVHRIYQPPTPATANGSGVGTNGSTGGAGGLTRSTSVTGHFSQKWVHHSTISYTRSVLVFYCFISV